MKNRRRSRRLQPASLRTFSFISFITTRREWSSKWHIFISKPTLEMIYRGNLSCGVFTLYFYCLSLMGFFLNNNPTKFIVYFFLLRVNERFPFINCNFWLWRHFGRKATWLIIAMELLEQCWFKNLIVIEWIYKSMGWVPVFTWFILQTRSHCPYNFSCWRNYYHSNTMGRSRLVI